MQKTIVCTSNDIFALFDVTDFKIRLGRPDLQMASDLSAGVCMTKFFDAQMDASMETGVENDFVSGLNQFMESSGQLRGTIKAGSFSGLGKRVTRIVTLATSKLEASRIRPSYINTGGKRKPMFDRLQNNNMVKRLGAVMGKVQLTAPIHAIDSTLTYMMGVVSGLEDMAQVHIFQLSSWNMFFSRLHGTGQEDSHGPVPYPHHHVAVDMHLHHDHSLPGILVSLARVEHVAGAAAA
jgi:hypothetical protein